MSKVQTVTGEVEASELGITMMHEHLLPADFGPPPRRPVGEEVDLPPFERPLPPHDVAFLARELGRARDLYGLRTVVDCSPPPQRNLKAIREVAEATGLNLVVSTGSYKEPRITAFVHRAGVQEVADLFVREILEGIEGTALRAGMIKAGSSMERITRVEEKVLRAAARAHLRTGAPITAHATVGTMGQEQVRIFEEEGVDLSRVVIAHCDCNANLAYHEGILRPGATCGFDTLGKERFNYTRLEMAGYHRHEFELEAFYIPESQRRGTLLELLRRGYAAQVVLSSDIVKLEPFVANPATIGTWGYSHVLGWFVPTLRRSGVSDQDVHRMLVEAPRRILAGA